MLASFRYSSPITFICIFLVFDLSTENTDAITLLLFRVQASYLSIHDAHHLYHLNGSNKYSIGLNTKFSILAPTRSN